MQEFFDIGKIISVHGLKGELKIYPYTDSIERFDLLEWVYIGDEKSKTKMIIESIKYFKNIVCMKVKGIDSRTDAEKLKNKYIIIDRVDAIVPEKNSYFINDLIGCNVTDTTYGDLGEIFEVLQPGANDVYVVRKKDKEVLIPAIKDVVLEVNIAKKKIVVKVLDGLLGDGYEV